MITSVSSAHLSFLTAADQVRPTIMITMTKCTRLTMITITFMCKISTTTCRLLVVRTLSPLLPS